jgi:hypothetical protein
MPLAYFPGRADSSQVESAGDVPLRDESIGDRFASLERAVVSYDHNFFETAGDELFHPP